MVQFTTMPSNSEAKSFLTNVGQSSGSSLASTPTRLRYSWTMTAVSFTVWLATSCRMENTNGLPSLTRMPSAPGLNPASASSALARAGSYG